jgi:hypothetical protein
MDNDGKQISVLTDADIDRIAERVIEKFGDRWTDREQHHHDHTWVKGKRENEVALSESKRRILEKIVGTAGAVGIMGLLAWVGSAILETLAKAAAHMGGG